MAKIHEQRRENINVCKRVIERDCQNHQETDSFSVSSSTFNNNRKLVRNTLTCLGTKVNSAKEQFKRKHLGSKRSHFKKNISYYLKTKLQDYPAWQTGDGPHSHESNFVTDMTTYRLFPDRLFQK